MSRRTAVLILVALLAGGASAWLMPKPLPELSRAEFLDEVRAGHVRAVEIEDEEVILGESSVRGEFRTRFDKSEDAGLLLELRALGVETRFTKSGPGLI